MGNFVHVLGTSAIDKPILILGGGINGAAIARELLLNRTPVCLVDLADLAFGTTAFSSRLIHGGLRYLEYGEFDLVRESLSERRRLLRLAPQFVRPLRLHIPGANRTGGLRQAAARLLGWPARLTPSSSRGLWLTRTGLWLYDLYARDPQIGKRAVHQIGDPGVPAADKQRFRWLCCYRDAQIVYPERFVVAMLEDARQLSAEHRVAFDVFTYHRASLRGRVAELRRAAGDEEVVAAIEPAAIVNATGAWVDRTLKSLNVTSRRLIGGTRGSHFFTFHPVLRELLRGQGVYAEAPDGRPVFILPWQDATLVGTTEVPFDDSPEKATASEAELIYLLNAVNHVFPDAALARADIDMHYCGVRPLPYVDRTTPAAITRRHRLEESEIGGIPLISVIGGKLTTCRTLAEQVAAKILAQLGRRLEANSRERVFPGGESYPSGEEELAGVQDRAAGNTGFAADQVRAVWSLCGTRTEPLLSVRRRDRNGTGAEPENLDGTSLPLPFVRRVIQDEWVAKIGDLVERRLMLLYDRNLSRRCLRQLAALMVEEGKLRDQEADSQIEACVQRWHAHFGKRLKD